MLAVGNCSIFHIDKMTDITIAYFNYVGFNLQVLLDLYHRVNIKNILSGLHDFDEAKYKSLIQESDVESVVLAFPNVELLTLPEKAITSKILTKYYTTQYEIVTAADWEYCKLDFIVHLMRI